MKTLFRAALLLSIAALGTARADEPALEGDLAKLQGTWTAKVGPEKNIPLTLTFKDRKVSLTFTGGDGQERAITGELKIDEKASPKTLDWTKFTRPDGQEAPDNLGIYELDGDTLKVCSGGPGNPRPTEFKAGEDGPPRLVVFSREKK